jgi:hypothetical protein
MAKEIRHTPRGRYLFLGASFNTLNVSVLTIG